MFDFKVTSNGIYLSSDYVQYRIEFAPDVGYSAFGCGSEKYPNGRIDGWFFGDVFTYWAF